MSVPSGLFEQKNDELQLVQRLLKIGIALSAERDLGRFLQLIVSEAKILTSADAASLYLCEGDRLRFKIIQNSKTQSEDTQASFPDIPLPSNIKDCHSIAGYVVLSGQTLNIENVYDIPDDAPYVFDPKFDKITGYKTQSMVTVPLLNPSGEAIGALQLINHTLDQNGHALTIAFPSFETNLAESLASQAAVGYTNILLETSLRKAYNDTLCRLSAAAEYRDPETADHLLRMSHYSRIIARELGMSLTRQNILFEASPMHDIGKIGIADAILLKPGPLNTEERTIMQSHAAIGEHILSGSDSELMQTCAIIAGSHHEKYDGSGYPKGLSGKDIPIEGRIIALADVFDALVSKRVYKEAWTLETVLAFIRDQSGHHFDPEVVEAFFKGLDDIVAIYNQYKPGQAFNDQGLNQTLSVLHA